MTDDTPSPALPPPPPRWRSARRLAAAAALLLGGLAIGSGVTALSVGRTPLLVSLQPAPIASLQPWTAAAVKGTVADVFGGRFVVKDDTGRALVDVGPAAEDSPIVKPDEVVTVQGRFERGALHAVAVTHADGRTDMLGPPGPGGSHGPLAWLDRHWRGPHGPGA